MRVGLPSSPFQVSVSLQCVCCLPIFSKPKPLKGILREGRQGTASKGSGTSLPGCPAQGLQRQASTWALDTGNSFKCSSALTSGLTRKTPTSTGAFQREYNGTLIWTGTFEAAWLRCALFPERTEGDGTQMGSCDEQTWEGVGAKLTGTRYVLLGVWGLLKVLCVC